MTLNNNKILISCANGKKINQLEKILKRHSNLKVYFTDINYSKRNNKFFFLNLGVNNKNYFKQLIYNLNKHNIKKYLPLADEEVLVASKYKRIFSKYKIKVYCNKYNLVKILNDKIKTLKLLQKYNIPVPIWKKYNSSKTFIQSVEYFFDLNLDLVLKPIVSRGNRNINFFKKKNYKILKCSYNKFKRNFFFNEMLYPEYYDVDIFSKNITNKNNVIIRKNLNPLKPTIYKGFKIVRKMNFAKSCKYINNKIGNEFLIDVDAMTDGEGKVKIIEVNSRPSGAFTYSLQKNSNLKNDFIKYLSK